MSPQQARTLLRVLPIALLVGLGLTIGGSYMVRLHVALALYGIEAPGEVVALETGTSSSAGRQPAFFPVVTFETANGRQVTFRHRTGQRPPAFRIGDAVPVTYMPDDPDRALIAEGLKNWLLPGVLILVGPLLTVLSIRGIFGARRRLRS